MTTPNDDYHRDLVHQLATSALQEQRSRRRWGIFFKLLFFAYLIGVTVAYSWSTQRSMVGDGKDHVAVIVIDGVITANSPNSAESINGLLRSAFWSEGSVGVILQINSPGGSAVEANRIYKEIRRLREQYPDKQVMAVAGDFCASGGYYIASAADSIYADPASVIGSIGVIYSSFGFVDTLEKLGVERRVITAGADKNLLDPFLPEHAEGRQAIRAILSDVHQVFIEAVKNGRGERLKNDGRIFTGTFFSGVESVELGLIDGLNDVGGVARDVIKNDYVRYYQETKWWDELKRDFGHILFNNFSGVQAVATGS